MDDLRFDPAKKELLDSPDRRKLLPPEKLLSLLPIKNNHVILDLGAGTGYFAIPAAQMTLETVFALDIEPELLADLKTKMEEQNISNIELLEASITNIPLTDHSVDCVIASLVLHAIKPLSLGIAEIKRVMKDEAYLLCFDWEPKESPIGPPMNIRVSSSEMEEELNKAGLTIAKRLSPTDFLYIFVVQK
ncbi:ubiquinone/menaquinone biosynthesis C-methylase UbiE [Paenibacillus sp. V4I3]|uniref:class I SAM-dependent methyltransferase n=1 Tax=Paenibacillus sp. V4I3 TaxID=3042305 RepID=UPI002782EBF7|nr:class I SAM-dependent methyltransferase [Paenibacillus sp. V4I3]MDQ0876567.1 ubiquinone/menaquinone biosynthesis C-methylase UbiE [Paenibacillus sp. V4I3]